VSSTPIVRVERVLEPDRSAPSIARDSVRAACTPLCPRLVEDAMLLTSEVVTNAVEHGSAPVRLCIDCDAHGIVVSVDDCNPILPKALRTDRRRHSGRGLVLVERLAAEWGVRPTKDGKQVWFRLA
jgi:anti-sigma regulatory factor (Ser/Thr protein kinase)